MRISKYIEVVKKTDQLEPKAPTDPNYKLAPILGLAGEIGSLLAELKKRVREPTRIKRTSKEKIKEELGDILWYAATVAYRAGIDFRRDVLYANLERIKENPDLYLPLLDDDDQPGKMLRDAVEKDGIRTTSTFKQYQVLAAKSARFDRNQEAIVPYLAKIWKNSGDLLGKLNLKVPDFATKEKKVVAQVLGDVMWYVAGFATIYHLDLNIVAKFNAKKTLSMFIPKEERKRTPLYDKGFLPLESFGNYVLDIAGSSSHISVKRTGNSTDDQPYRPDFQ